MKLVTFIFKSNGNIEDKVVFEFKKACLKGVFAKNERGYRLNAIKKRF